MRSLPRRSCSERLPAYARTMLTNLASAQSLWGRLQVGIASMWYEGNPCNMHLLDLAAEVKRGVVEAGMVGYRFNTIGVSDGMSMGTEGMSYSLQSRDLIADSVETVMGGQARARPRARSAGARTAPLAALTARARAQWYDANVSLPGCDKNMPGVLMAMARNNRPAIMVYGGTIRPGHSRLSGETLDIVSAFQSYGAPARPAALCSGCGQLTARGVWLFLPARASTRERPHPSAGAYPAAQLV